MNTADWIQILLAVTGCISGIGVPVIVLYSNRNRSHLLHLDECIDKLRLAMVSSTITKEDFMAYRAEHNETLSRVRAAISNDTNGLHNRIMRLENIYLKGIG